MRLYSRLHRLPDIAWTRTYLRWNEPESWNNIDVLAKDEWLEENVIKDNYYFYAQKITGHNSDFSEISVSYTDGEIVAEKANVLNSYSDLAFYYDKTDKIQGYCVWNPYTELDYERPMDVTEREQSYSWSALIDGMLFNVQRDDIDRKSTRLNSSHWS